MSEHTPGPWRFDGCEIIGNSRIVATTAWCSGMGPEDEANAHLIVAAPDLLDALKTCRCPCGGWNGMGDIEPTVENCMKAEACGCDCGAAILKATGVAQKCGNVKPSAKPEAKNA